MVTGSPSLVGGDTAVAPASIPRGRGIARPRGGGVAVVLRGVATSRGRERSGGTGYFSEPSGRNSVADTDRGLDDNLNLVV